jgi:glycerate kinase
MKLVLAPDKFKGSLTGLEFCDAVEQAIKKVIPKAEILKLPLADGGDGAIEVANYYLKGDLVSITVNNPFFQPVKASYLFAPESNYAFIEMAEASGLKILDSEKLNCKKTTTFGTGEMIVDAINKGAINITLGIGGSATNDCGIGMASALGFQFKDEFGEEVIPIGLNLSKIDSIITSNVHPKLKDISFKIACDVTNPLYGSNGAAHVYAEQKGASSEDIDLLDQGLKDFALVLNASFNLDVQSIVGGGAAGGMGVASKVFLNGELQPGIDLIKKLAKFDAHAVDADYIITGEGKLDSQTLSGKTIKGVLQTASKHNIPVAVFCGISSLKKNEVEKFGISYIDAILNNTSDLKSAMSNTKEWIKKMAENFAKNLLLRIRIQ